MRREVEREPYRQSKESLGSRPQGGMNDDSQRDLVSASLSGPVASV
jgi:hypothetical protein